MVDDPYPLSRIDPDSPIPLYFQVESDLRRLIDDGTWPPGAMVPPEQDLAQGYQVSRQTVRQALGRLAADGLVSRSAGRGTFVKITPDKNRFYLDRSFTQQMAEMGRQAHSLVLKSREGVIHEEAPAPLQRRRGAPCLYLARLRFGDEEPIGIQQTTLITVRCPGLVHHDFATASLYEVLSQKYHLSITEIHHTISATIANDQQAALLHIDPGSPLLVVYTTTFLNRQEVIEFTTSYYRADRYEYSTTHLLS